MDAEDRIRKSILTEPQGKLKEEGTESYGAFYSTGDEAG